MLVLAVAAALRDNPPAVVLDQPDDVAELHRSAGEGRSAQSKRMSTDGHRERDTVRP